MTRRLRSVVLLGGLLLSLGAVGGAPGGSETNQADKVTYSTGFGFFGREAPIYVAIEKGYLAKENIEVTVVPGTGTLDVSRLIAAGRVDFGIGDFTAMIVARANENVNVKGVYAIYQSTLSAILSLRKTGINTPKDLEGKTWADSPASTVKVLFSRYAKRMGIDESKVHFVPSAPPQLPSLLGSGRVDAVGQFVVGIPTFSAAAGGQPVQALRYSRAFPGLLGSVIMASDSTLARRPGLTRRFLRAFDKGVRYCVDNPADCGRIIKKHQPLTDDVVAAKEWRLGKQFVRTRQTRQKGYGYMDPKRVDATISVVVNAFRPNARPTRRDVSDLRFLPGSPKKRK
jgi:NitT/TauT family transport system substrate-binding protein